MLACVVLTGCASYQPQPITPTQLAKNFEQRTLADDALRAYLSRQVGHPIKPWPLPRWNREMLTLAAYYYSPALDIARAQWGTRSEERRVGKECVSTCRSRWSPYH